MDDALRTLPASLDPNVEQARAWDRNPGRSGAYATGMRPVNSRCLKHLPPKTRLQILNARNANPTPVIVASSAVAALTQPSSVCNLGDALRTLPASRNRLRPGIGLQVKTRHQRHRNDTCHQQVFNASTTLNPSASIERSRHEPRHQSAMRRQFSRRWRT